MRGQRPYREILMEQAVVIKDALCADVAAWNRVFDAGDEERADALRAEMAEGVAHAVAFRVSDGSWHWEWGLAGARLGSVDVRMTGPVGKDGEIADATLQCLQDGAWTDVPCTEDEKALLYDAALFALGNCDSLIEEAVEEEIDEGLRDGLSEFYSMPVDPGRGEGDGSPQADAVRHNVAVVCGALEENRIGGLVAAFGGEAGEGSVRIDLPKAEWIFALPVRGLLEDTGEGLAAPRPDMRLDAAVAFVGAEVLDSLYGGEWKEGDGALGRIVFMDDKARVMCGSRAVLAEDPAARWDRAEIGGRHLRRLPEEGGLSPSP